MLNEQPRQRRGSAHLYQPHRIGGAHEHPDPTCRQVIAALSPRARALLAASQATIRVLAPGERFIRASAELRRLRLDVDKWVTPPTGLFVVAERCAYIRNLALDTLGHEVAHALDAALGNGVYFSGIDPATRAAFKRATERSTFVSAYAACDLDEYFAEGVRAFFGLTGTFIGPAYSPAALRERLRAIDPRLYGILSRQLT